jgi:hypothetical protein
VVREWIQVRRTSIKARLRDGQEFEINSGTSDDRLLAILREMRGSESAPKDVTGDE